MMSSVHSRSPPERILPREFIMAVRSKLRGQMPVESPSPRYRRIFYRVPRLNRSRPLPEGLFHQVSRKVTPAWTLCMLAPA